MVRFLFLFWFVLLLFVRIVCSSLLLLWLCVSILIINPVLWPGLRRSVAEEVALCCEAEVDSCVV
eukprot:9883847-Prorocentrum_lima.AAC.1